MLSGGAGDIIGISKSCADYTNLILKYLELVFDGAGRRYILNVNELVYNQYVRISMLMLRITR